MQEKYGGQFIAVLNDAKVVAHARTFNDVVAKLREISRARDIGTSIRIRRIQPKREVEGTA
jgi:hypothetical protein